MSVSRGAGIVMVLLATSAGPSLCDAAGTAGSRRQSIRISDLAFLPRTYFFLHDRPAQIHPGSVVLWRWDGTNDNDPMPEVNVRAVLDPRLPLSETNPLFQRLFHVLQRGADYDLIAPWSLEGAPDGFEILVIRLHEPLGPSEALAAYYIYLDDPGGSPAHMGLYQPPYDPVAKMIRTPLSMLDVDPETGIFDASAPWFLTQRNELRNVYDIGTKSVPLDQIRIGVRREEPGAIADPDRDHLGNSYLEILGLDAKSVNGDPWPDGRVDAELLDLNRGVLFFPDLHPFDPHTASVPECAADFGGFLCLDNHFRNPLRRGSEYESWKANPLVYYKGFPDPVADSHYYIEVEVLPPPPSEAVLHQNAPNPFNPETLIRFDLKTSERARVTVLDIRGRVVARLVDAVGVEGTNWVRWSGTDGSGRPVASGVYFYRLETPSVDVTRKMVLAR
jgi:hypothetical protein